MHNVNGTNCHTCQITPRDYFAGIAMERLLLVTAFEYEDMAKESFIIADKIMKARDAQQPKPEDKQ